MDEMGLQRRIERLREKRTRGERLRVLLVRTSAPGVAYWPQDRAFELPECQVIAPVGALYLASVLRAELPDLVDVDVTSLSTAVRTPDEMADWLATEGPDVVGLSALNSERASATALATAARVAVPEAVVITGGAYATYLPEACLKWTDTDLAVRGEAEAIIAPLLRALTGDGDLRQVPGLALRDGDQTKLTHLPAPIDPLDQLPHPAWDLLQLETYSSLYNMSGVPVLRPPYVPLLTSRGCPFRCSFCHNFFGPKFRPRSADDVLAEMAELHDHHGVREFHIVDDVFNFAPGRLEAIAHGIIERGWDVALAFPNGIRGDTLTREQLELLARAGCVSLCLSLESAAPRIQQLMHKRLDLQRLAEAVRIAADVGIITKLIFMVGYPGETRDEMEQTIRWVRDSACHVSQHSIATPLPGTEMYRHAREFDPSFDFSAHSTADYNAYRPLTELDEAELREVLEHGVDEILSVPERQARIREVVSRWPAAQLRYFDRTWTRALELAKPAPKDPAAAPLVEAPGGTDGSLALEPLAEALRARGELGTEWQISVAGEEVLDFQPPTGPSVRMRLESRDEQRPCVGRSKRFNLIYIARDKIPPDELGPILSDIVEACQRVDPDH